MSTDTKKQFVDEDHAKIYSSFRKDSPTELVEKITSFLKEKMPVSLETAVDVGCGTGQSTVILAPYFEHVHGCDISEAQIEQAKAARSLPNVTYAASAAEELPFSDCSVQLLTAGTSLHWFDLDRFLPEVRRTLSVNGVMAVYGYYYMKPEFRDAEGDAEIDELYDKYYETLEPHLMMGPLRMLQGRYEDVKFPFEEVIRCPDVRCRFEGRLPEIVNYVSTFSGMQNFRKADSRGAEKCMNSFQKRLYEIGAACGSTLEMTPSPFTATTC